MNDKKGWDSDDYAADFRKLSEVSDKGIIMVYSKLTHDHGENNYHAVHGIEAGISVAYLFASNGLSDLLEAKESEIKGESIKITPRGTEENRRYRVELA